MFEATKDGMQVMLGEEPRVKVNKVTWRKGSSRKFKKTGKHEAEKKNNEQSQNVTAQASRKMASQEKENWTFCPNMQK